MSLDSVFRYFAARHEASRSMQNLHREPSTGLAEALRSRRTTKETRSLTMMYTTHTCTRASPIDCSGSEIRWISTHRTFQPRLASVFFPGFCSFHCRNQSPRRVYVSLHASFMRKNVYSYILSQALSQIFCISGKGYCSCFK